MLDYDRGFLLVDDTDNLGDELFGICAEQPQFILVNACENSRCRAAGQCRAFGNFPDKVIIGGPIGLIESPLLNAIAESKARDMLEKQYFDHVSPAGEQVSDMAQKIGYRYRIISENIGMGNFLTNQKVIDGWMQSPGHRKNILSSEVEEMGAAIVKGNINGRKAWISVQIFGLQSKPVSN